MVEFGKKQVQGQTEKRPERTSMIRLGPNGLLQVVRPKAVTADEMSKTFDPYRISSYFQKVFSVDPKELRKAHEVMDCFYCADIKYHHVEMEVANGVSYKFSFACVCHRDDNTAPIMDLVRRGYYQLECQAWEVCKLEAKEAKCRMFNCRRFP